MKHHLMLGAVEDRPADQINVVQAGVEQRDRLGVRRRPGVNQCRDDPHEVIQITGPWDRRRAR